MNTAEQSVLDALDTFCILGERTAVTELGHYYFPVSEIHLINARKDKFTNVEGFSLEFELDPESFKVLTIATI